MKWKLLTVVSLSITLLSLTGCEKPTATPEVKPEEKKITCNYDELSKITDPAKQAEFKKRCPRFGEFKKSEDKKW